MAYCNSVLSQILKFVPRHEFEKAANRVDGKRRSDALSRWSQFVALAIGLDHDGLIPAFACITQGKVSDSDYAKKLALPRGSVLVFDRGYNSYRWHDTLSLHGIFFVSRLRGNAQYRVLERRAVPARGGITSDQTIEYTAARKDGAPLQPIRRVGYRDPDTGKHYVFISNQFQWSAQTIAAIYKQRWQVELFFKWIKQNLKIKAFLGNTENAVMTQIMAALCIYLLLAYLKFQSKLHQSLQQIIRLLQLNLFARRSLQDLLRPADTPDPPSPQLRLALVRN